MPDDQNIAREPSPDPGLPASGQVGDGQAAGLPPLDRVRIRPAGGDGAAEAARPEAPPIEPIGYTTREEVMRRLPEPFRLETSGTSGLQLETSSMLKPKTERVSRLRVLWRLLSIAVLGSYVAAARLLDLFFIRDEAKRDARGAERLRWMLETLGGALVKVGQQLSLRLDILPAAYCDALAGLLDKSEREIDLDYAVERIEAAAGKKLQQIFRAFDPDPIGSATIGCVYQAELITGERVAVKVRRPGIIKLFNADLTVLDWVMRVVEMLTIIRPGVSMVFRDEMRKLLLEELDFRIEARYQELFRRYYKKRPKMRVTAPKVYHPLSSEDVMVSEFVEGIWVKDLLAAINADDKEALDYVRSLNIKPKKIAKQLVWCSHYGLLECPFFHGDPHPGNIVLRPNNHIVMVDFGACGVFTEKERNLLRQMHYFKSKDDIGGMVQCVVALMEPLPPIDMEAFERDLQSEWWHAFYGILSKNAAWWERTSFRLWLALLGLLRHYEVPVPRHMLRMIRATLLYDTVAAQLHPKLDVFKEFQRYQRDVARRVKKDMQQSFVRQFYHGLDAENYLRLHRSADTFELGLYRLRQFLDQRQINFESLTDKAWEFVSSLAQLFLRFTTITIIFAAVAFFMSLEEFGVETSWWNLPEIYRQVNFWTVIPVLWNTLIDAINSEEIQTLEIVFTTYLGALGATTLIYARRALYRFRDKDVD